MRIDVCPGDDLQMLYPSEADELIQSVVDDGTSTKSVLVRSPVLDHSGFLAKFLVHLLNISQL